MVANFIVPGLVRAGNVREALQLTDELLELIPYHQRAMGNKKYYQDQLRERGMLNPRGDDARSVD